MSKSSLAFIILVSLTIIATLVLGVMFFFKPQVAGISIKSEPTATVLIDGVEVGKTPYESTRDPSEVQIKLIPESFSDPLLPYETKVDLVSGVKTAISYTFAQTLGQATAEILSFEKGTNRETGLAVISEPLDVNISINGSNVGMTPHKSNLSPGEYTMVLTKEGFNEKRLTVRVVEGYKLTAWIKLSPKVLGEYDDDIKTSESTKNPQPSDAVQPTPTGALDNLDIQYVTILDTGTGFLRVRKSASTLSEEVGRVIPKKEYELVEIDKKTGWFKIKFDNQSEGYISNQYARLKGESTQYINNP